MPEGRIPVVVVFGPTAVGKTAFLLNLSKIAEIINLDSMQVYKYMDIGTAKPDSDITSRIKHHLVDFLEPDMEFGAGEFTTQADRLCRDIWLRGKVPVISGGNAFFLKNFIYGMPEAPRSDENIRKMIASRLEREGIAALSEELEKIDPQYLNKIGKKDPYRIARALEVWYSSGKPISSFAVPDSEREEYDFLLIGLLRERKELYARINARVDAMFDKGLYDEFLRLRNMGYESDAPGMGGIGYREFFAFDNDPFITADDIREKIKLNTRHYAKRQITFFRKINNVYWENAENTSLILEKVSIFLDSYGKNL